MTVCKPELSEFEAQTFDQIARLIEAAESVVVSGHTDPDGDALGSNLALAQMIRLRWPHVRVTSLLADDAPVPRAYTQLPGADGLVRARDFSGAPDLFIAVDTPTKARLADAAAVLDRSRTSASIDHHPTKEPFALASVVREHAAAAGDVIFDFARHLGLELTPEVATCLLCAILTDTGRYQYQNTDAHAFRASAELVEAGARPAQVAAWVYQSATIEGQHLKALAMQRLALDESGLVAASYVTCDDLARLGATPEDCDSLIDVVRSVGGVDACVFLRERPDGQVRANLRSKAEGLDVAAVAARFGGGGHRAAAGLTLPGPMERALSEVVGAVAQAAREFRAREAEGGR